MLNRLTNSIQRQQAFARANEIRDLMTTSRVYISGPMSGMADWNKGAFRRAETHIRKTMLASVVNPVEMGTEGEWLDFIARDIALMSGCTHIALLPGWEQSHGARIEQIVADKLGMTIILLNGEQFNGTKVQEGDEDSGLNPSPTPA